MKTFKSFAEEMEASLVRAIKELIEDNPYDNPNSPESKASNAIRTKTTKTYQQDVHKRGWDHPDYVALVKKRNERAKLQAAKPKVAPKHDTSKALPSGFHGFDEVEKPVRRQTGKPEYHGATATQYGPHPGDRNPGYADRKSALALDAGRTAYNTGKADDHKMAARAHTQAATAHRDAAHLTNSIYHSDFERTHTERAKRHTQIANEGSSGK